MYEKESVVRGHHVYKAIWTPVIGDELEVRTEDDNYYYYYYELYSHLTGNDVSDGNKRNVEGSELG